MRRFFIILIIYGMPAITWAQCAMCRTQIKNNVSHGETELAAGLNLGILYLFFTPYIAIAVVAFLWYRYSRKDERRIGFIGRAKR